MEQRQRIRPRQATHPKWFWLLCVVTVALLGGWGLVGCSPFPLCTQSEDCAKPLLCNQTKGVCEAECSLNADCQDGKVCVNLRCIDGATPTPGSGLTSAQAAYLAQLQKYIKFEVDPKTKQTTVVIGSEGVEVTVSPTQREIWIKGANLHIVNGQGKTDQPSSAAGGLGNLIIGYNETNGQNVTRSGSHNLIIGMGHSYQSYGGLVAGQDNQILGPFSSITGGQNNVARERGASVSGGSANQALNPFSSVAGGQDNTAEGNHAHISGGTHNKVNGQWGSVLGGRDNHVKATSAVIAGGQFNVASGNYSAVLGGGGNTTAQGNTASDNYACVVGGISNQAAGTAAAVLGGNKVSTNQSYQSAIGNLSGGTGICDAAKACQ